MAESIEVSQEELRFLRRSFRRFALPYLLAGIVVAVAALLLGGARTPTGDSNEPAVQGLIAEAAALREALGTLREELDAAEARATERGGRMDQLDRRVARLAEQVSESPGSGTDAALRQRLDETLRRLNALEARVAVAERNRRNALAIDEDGAAGEAPPASGGDPVDWQRVPGGR